MEKYTCNECGSDMEAKVVIGERADCSYGEYMVCSVCGSEDINERGIDNKKLLTK